MCAVGNHPCVRATADDEEGPAQERTATADGNAMGRVALWLRRNAGLIASLALPLALLVLLRDAPRLDVGHESLRFHLIIASGIAACALLVALFAGAAAVTLRRPGVLFLAIGCVSCGTLMLVHGLVTPGVNHTPFNVWVARAPVLAIVCFAACQFAASFASRTRIARAIARHARVTLSSVCAVAALFAIVVLRDPKQLHGTTLFTHEAGLNHVVAAASILALLAVALDHWRRLRLGREAMQMVLALASTMSIAAVLAIEYGKVWHLSWWVYHGYLFGAFFAIAAVIIRRYFVERVVHSALDSAFAVDPIEHIRHGYPDALRALVAAVELKDSYTHGHSRRTANLATALGVRLRLAPEDIRLLAQGAYLHDVGKIAIPDSILNKPGRLDDDERTVIETHAAVGAEMVSQASSLVPCAPIVRHHHERFDGNGYPDRIAGNDIPLLARITAVADVWDALTSDRAYRKGWEPSQALAHIVDGRGTHFDPVVVDALVELANEWGYRNDRRPGNSAEAWAALQNCHESGTSRAPEVVQA
jgi:putative nucleotidyltransferase with HDIG domain